MNEKTKAIYKAMGIEARSITPEEADSMPILIHFGPELDALSKSMRKKKQEQKKLNEKQPQNPEELVEALREKGFQVSVKSRAQLDPWRWIFCL